MSNNRKVDLDRYAACFKALSNPNRLKIFLRLVSCCAPGTRHSVDCVCDTGAYVGQLGQDLDIAPSTVSHHIKELRQAGIIRVQRDGQRMECWIDPEVLRELADFFSL